MTYRALQTRRVPSFGLIEEGKTYDSVPEKLADTLVAQGYLEKVTAPRKPTPKSIDEETE